jgi:hypothetical protein
MRRWEQGIMGKRVNEIMRKRETEKRSLFK